MTLVLTDDAAAIQCDADECDVLLETERARFDDCPEDGDDDAALTERATTRAEVRCWLAEGARHFCPAHLPPPARVYTRDEVQAICLALWQARYAGAENLVSPPTEVTVEPSTNGLVGARWRHKHHGYGPDEAYALADLVQRALDDATRAADGCERGARELREAVRKAPKLEALAQRIRDAVSAAGCAP